MTKSKSTPKRKTHVEVEPVEVVPEVQPAPPVEPVAQPSYREQVLSLAAQVKALINVAPGIDRAHLLAAQAQLDYITRRAA